MRLGEILVGRGIVSSAAVVAAMQYQRQTGGRLGEILVRMGAIPALKLNEAMEAITAETPRQPFTIAETGIPENRLIDHMLKFMLVQAVEAFSDISRVMHLSFPIIQELMNRALQRKLVQALGIHLATSPSSDLRYALLDAGRATAIQALRQNQYLGPAPVTLAEYRAQVIKQRIGNEMVSIDRLWHGMKGLSVPPHYIRKLLPAINAGKTILLFGPPGNGKTTVASRMAGLFSQVVHIPYAVDIGGHTMTVYDPTIHQRIISEDERAVLESPEVGGQEFDDRWVACRRPFVMVGGELTVDMLDLKHDPDTGFYDAPQHVKALNGVFLVDDFGRQRVAPGDVLNRWIVPMESRIDFLRLHTGKSITLPFDQLLVFSTNIDPNDFVDPALLRRIPYKVLVSGPSEAEYRALFMSEAGKHDLTIENDVISFIIGTLTGRGKFELAYFQARFVCDQVAEICRCFGLPRRITRELAIESLSNLYIEIEEEVARPGRDARPQAGH